MRIEKKTRISIAARAVAVVVVVAFCFHLSRFYVSVETCAHHTEDGNALQHCKDIPGWLTAPRAQLGAVSAPAPEPSLEPVRVIAFLPNDVTHDIPLPPPFHPPRFLN